MFIWFDDDRPLIVARMSLLQHWEQRKYVIAAGLVRRHEGISTRECCATGDPFKMRGDTVDLARVRSVMGLKAQNNRMLTMPRWELRPDYRLK
jgi:hypothetical protein